MATNCVDLSLLCFNLHGFNQGELYLQEVCSAAKHDVIFIQEHWLTPDNLVKLKSISCNYFVYGKSAMESALSKSFLRSRP